MAFVSRIAAGKTACKQGSSEFEFERERPFFIANSASSGFAWAKAGRAAWRFMPGMRLSRSGAETDKLKACRLLFI
ncbi:hypothetical protein [Ottowia cancrivicina]|uniref:Uncharacterized protein n=1 Tax=Ottowia cancrivicina TaxID=3040346 RepID=A0AAW6RMH3_9BURK|nr:hypothetical protein [Ottowia sp. 10c7w1]MDG9700057.1 hypothetical protein [Ottowia sp. 10c7w1]